MSLPQYPEYKHSGVAWLGEVPLHWQVRPFKWLIEKNDGGVWGNDPDGNNDTLVLRSTEQTVDGRWKLDEPAFRKLTQNEKDSALLRAGDLLVTKSSGSSLHIGKTTLVDDEIESLSCCYSNFIQRVRVTTELLPKLAWFVLNNDLARIQFDLLSNSTTGLANLNGTMIGDVLLPTGPISEQTAIVTFLDRETAKIDGLIAEQETLLTLLAEKRQATISLAVTQGLNPDAPMKDSGVAWLGEIPAHWKVIPLKALFRQQKRQGFPDKDVLSVYRDFGVVRKDSRNDNFNKTPDDLSSYQIVEPGDLVVNKMKGWQGSLGVSELEGITSPDYMVFPPLHTESSTFLHLFLRSAPMVSTYRSISNGIRPSQWRLEPEQFLSTKILLPPLPEQLAITGYCFSEISKIEALLAETELASALLKERRTALVSAAVTGKIDVRQS